MRNRWLIYWGMLLILVVGGVVSFRYSLLRLPYQDTLERRLAAAETALATLTVAASENQASQSRIGPTSTPPVSSPIIQLPPPVPDWQMIPKPMAEMGAPDAPVVLVEYSDFQCPWCTRFHQEVMPQLKPLIEAGSVRFIYKHLPVLGERSYITARAAECAGFQGDFWTLHDWLFDNSDQWKGAADGRATVAAAAANLGYDPIALESCVDDLATQQSIAQDVEEAQRYGLRGTPSFVLNGRLIPGFLPWEQFGPLVEVSKAEALGEPLPEGYELAPTPPPPDTSLRQDPVVAAGEPQTPTKRYIE